jgi:hypothetical protein
MRWTTSTLHRALLHQVRKQRHESMRCSGQAGGAGQAGRAARPSMLWLLLRPSPADTACCVQEQAAATGLAQREPLPLFPEGAPAAGVPAGADGDGSGGGSNDTAAIVCSVVAGVVVIAAAVAALLYSQRRGMTAAPKADDDEPSELVRRGKAPMMHRPVR